MEDASRDVEARKISERATCRISARSQFRGAAQLRVFVARGFISFGMWLLPADVRKLMRGMMLFHVPGALTEDEKHEVIVAKSAWRKSRPQSDYRGGNFVPTAAAVAPEHYPPPSPRKK